MTVERTVTEKSAIQNDDLPYRISDHWGEGLINIRRLRQNRNCVRIVDGHTHTHREREGIRNESCGSIHSSRSHSLIDVLSRLT